MFNLELNFLTDALIIAVEAIAIIEALKNFIKEKNGKLPGWLYTIAEVFLCFGLAILKCESFTFQEIRAQLELGLLALAVSQLSYESLWKAVKIALKKCSAKIGGGENECEN